MKWSLDEDPFTGVGQFAVAAASGRRSLIAIQSDISRRRPFAGAALYERRNPPVADRRYSFRASTTYVVMYKRIRRPEAAATTTKLAHHPSRIHLA